MYCPIGDFVYATGEMFKLLNFRFLFSISIFYIGTKDALLIATTYEKNII